MRGSSGREGAIFPAQPPQVSLSIPEETITCLNWEVNNDVHHAASSLEFFEQVNSLLYLAGISSLLEAQVHCKPAERHLRVNPASFHQHNQ